MIKTNFLHYLGLCNATPASWRVTLICGVDNCEMNLLPSPSDLGNWTCQYASSFYISKIFHKPTSEARLIRAGFTDQISALHSLPFKVTKNIKLSMFQFKINHNIIYTRDKLFGAKIVENDKCQACGSKQTLVHLLVGCQYVDTFWNSLASWWNSCHVSRVNLLVTDKIYAHHPEKLSFCTLNFCLIVAHFYIYTASKEN